MAKKKQPEKPKTKSGGVQITLMSEFTYPNGLKLKAGKTYTVTHAFYEELSDGGYLEKLKIGNKTHKN